MQPIVLQGIVTLAAGAQNPNVLDSISSIDRYRRCPFPCQIELFVSVSDADLTFSFEHAASRVVDSSSARVRVAGTLLESEDLINDEIYSGEGEQLVLRANNADASSQTITFKLVLNPLAQPGEQVQLPMETLVTQSGPVALTATTVDLQLLTGRFIERFQRPGLLTIFASASTNTPQWQVYVGQANVVPPMTANVANNIPSALNDRMVDGVEVAADTQIQISVSNATGTPSVFFRAELQIVG